MNAIWKGAKAIMQGDPVEKYLFRRCGLTAFPKDLRFLPDGRHYTGPGEYTVHPTMLAMVRDPGGKPVNLHRTFLTPDGLKAPLGDEARKLMEGELPKGSAIRLAPAGEELGVAEGIETAFSAGAIFKVPTWALISADNLAAWTPPEGVTRVQVFGDHDVSYTGQFAAFNLAKRLRAQREPRLDDVAVRLPPLVGDDWNDVHDRIRREDHASTQGAQHHAETP